MKYDSKMKSMSSLRTTDGEAEALSSVVREVAVMPGLGETISVRAAKAHLSGLLDLVAAGREMIITSGGQPKVRMSPFEPGARRKTFQGATAHLARMGGWKGGPTAEEVVREDREERGW